MSNQELNFVYKNVLDKTKTIVYHHKQLTRAKGELFNIYNILNVKTKEVRTHSAFIAELLNPNGTHLMKDAFLQAFIKRLPKDKFETHLDYSTTVVTVEYYISVINKKKKLGGRIDILLKDRSGNSICIENKIDAGDLDDQVERYYNYNTVKNRVIYLSKFGEEPSTKSKGKLITGEHFEVVGYNEEIISWLEQCQKIASDQPILRESIKQYKILIQNITNKLGNQEDKELREVVLNNLEEASHIASKYHSIVFNLKDKFKKNIHKILVQKLPNFTVTNRKDVSANCSNIWFSNTILNQKKVWFGVESFSGKGHMNGVLFVGIFDKNNQLNLDKGYNSINKTWVHHKVILYNGLEVNLSNNSFLKEISTKEKRESIASDVANQIITFIEKFEHLIID